MRSLVVTPTPTHPADQGNRARVFQIAQALRRRGRVDVLYSAVDGLDDGSVAAMRSCWDALFVVPAGPFRPQRQSPDHWGLDEWVSPNLMETVRTLAAGVDYDVVVVNYVWCSWVLTLFDPARTLRVLDTHDAFGDRHLHTRAAGVAPHWFYTTAAEEARGLDRADVVLAIQPEEGAAFREMTQSTVEVIEYALQPIDLPPRVGPGVVVGYFGSGNPWNVDSLQGFDALLATRPTLPATFLAIGGVTRKARGLRVFQPVGMVDAVADAYAPLDLVLNPMRGGTGLKIKTVEALAHGRAVLSTRDGGLGLEAVHPDLLHPDLDSLLARLLSLLSHPRDIPALAQAMQAGYVTFAGDVALRLAALVAGWADRERSAGR